MLKDSFPSMSGKIKIQKVDSNGILLEEIDLGKNAITFRAKTMMSRLLGGGMNADGAFDFGTTLQTLQVTGMALGNGGHLIFDSSIGVTSSLVTLGGGTVLNVANIDQDLSRPAMPLISLPDTYGYQAIQDQQISGPTYEQVANGNIPFDGSVVLDNSIGVTTPGTTLFSETFRLPLDTTDGITFPTETEVQFKATLPQDRLNNVAPIWGFAQQQSNVISEAGLITGFTPNAADILANTNQLYSDDGGEPTPTGPNFNTTWTQKDNDDGTFSLNPHGTLKPDDIPSHLWDAGNFNTWNMLARKTFPGIAKSAEFSLVFIWILSF